MIAEEMDEQLDIEQGNNARTKGIGQAEMNNEKVAVRGRSLEMIKRLSEQSNIDDDDLSDENPVGLLKTWNVL
jgi:hypothetical protein